MKKRNIIAFLNMKGGVCKTTLCKEIALCLSNINKKKILIIDMDPQSNCTQSFFERYNVLGHEEDKIITDSGHLPSIENIFSQNSGRLEQVTLEKTIYKLENNLHIIPGELHAIFMERETGSGASEQKLNNFIENNNLKEKYDYIFIDCPPIYSFYTIATLFACDLCLVPVVPDAYSLLGVDLLEEVVKHAKNTYKANFQYKPLDNLGIIFTKIPNGYRAGIQNNIIQIKEALSDKNIYIFENYFMKSEKIITSQLSKFIIDRQDEALKNNIIEICNEFEREVNKYNEQKNNIKKDN